MKNLELMVESANHCYEHGIDFTVHPRLFLDVVKTLRSLVEENATLDCAIGAVVDAYEGGARDVLAEAIDAAVNVKTPVTDKVLNSFMASGADLVGERLKERSASFSGAETTGLEYAAILAADFASELRAGKDGE